MSAVVAVEISANATHSPAVAQHGSDVNGPGQPWSNFLLALLCLASSSSRLPALPSPGERVVQLSAAAPPHLTSAAATPASCPAAQIFPATGTLAVESRRSAANTLLGDSHTYTALLHSCAERPEALHQSKALLSRRRTRSAILSQQRPFSGASTRCKTSLLSSCHL